MKREQFYFANDTVSNRIIQYSTCEALPRLVFVPNWRAREKHWHSFAQNLATHFRVDYFETREKLQTRFHTQNTDFRVEAMGKDLVNYLNQIDEPYHLITVSMGASSLVKAWSELRNLPLSQVMICPVVNLHMPGYFHLFKFIPEKMIKVVRPIVFEFISRSPKLKQTAGALYKAFKNPDLTELKIVKSSIQDLIRLEMDLSETAPLKNLGLVIYTLDDGIHLQQDSLDILSQHPQADSFSVNTFREAHDAKSAAAICEWYQQKGYITQSQAVASQA